MSRNTNESPSVNMQPERPISDQTAMRPKGMPPVKKTRRGILSWILFLALLAVSIWAYVLYRENEMYKNPDAQVTEVINQMRKHVILPEDEVPGVFRITPDQLDEPFFKNAQEGDLLVAYQSTQQAFVYSPSRDILVNAGVLIINPTQEEIQAPEQQTATDTSDALVE